MSFDVSPLGASPYAASPSIARSARATARRRRSRASAARAAPPIPTEVWDQVDAAARLAENLTAEGRQVRFDVHKLDGGVVASLVDENGGLLRPLLLQDVVDVTRLSHELGKESVMAGIQVGGLASGMDTESIITQLMSIEQAPRTRTARQQVDRPGASGRAARDRHQAHQSQAGRRRPALGRAVVAQADRHQRHRGRAHGPPAHAARPPAATPSASRRWPAPTRAPMRGTPAAAAHRRLQGRRRQHHADQDLRPHRHEPRRRGLHGQQRRHLARLGRQRRRQALAVAPRDRRPRHLGLRRLRDRRGRHHQHRATARTPPTPSPATPPPTRRTPTSPATACPASS